MKAKKKYFIAIAALVIVSLTGTFIFLSSKGENASEFYVVKRGKFEALLSCKGEISGLKATEIKAPPIICDRELELWYLNIIE